MVAGCNGGSSSNKRKPSGILEVNTISNRADLISGGDALVEILLEADVDVEDVVVKVNEELDVSSAFRLVGEGRLVGLVAGFKEGENRLSAYSGENTKARTLTVTNHPLSGPIFSGPQLEPWICATPTSKEVQLTDPATGNIATVTTRSSGLDEEPDEHCHAASKRTYYYQPADKDPETCSFGISGASACFTPYTLDSPPAREDVADFTNDLGETVKSMLLVEYGTLNRGMYSLVTFYDPSAPHHPAEPQKGWNGKLILNFGGSSGGSRFQEPSSTPFFNELALRKGYMLARTSLNDNANNVNHAVAAETLMMLKEKITETFGEIRFTVGSGGSGGAIQQFTMASSYPGLMDGLLPSLTFADSASTSIEVGDCGLFIGRYYDLEHSLTRQQQTAVTGISTTQCTLWATTFLPSGDPTRASNCGSGFPQDLTYHPEQNPAGVSCILSEHNRNLVGTIITADGYEKAPMPIDNVGVQYGLEALQNKVIDAESFVHLNESIGYLDADQKWIQGAERLEAQADLKNVYRSGMVAHAANLELVPIVETRHNAGSIDFHANWRAMMIRDRLERDNGHSDNHIILALGSAAMALEIMDEWLTAIKADNSAISLAEKVVSNRPATAADACFVGGADVGFGTDACPVKFDKSPRQVAGGPIAEDVFKCQLKPLDFDSSDYEGVTFTNEQKDRLKAVFPTGVCNWDRPGVGQEKAITWPTFMSGPGGEPLGEAPTSI